MEQQQQQKPAKYHRRGRVFITLGENGQHQHKEFPSINACKAHSRQVQMSEDGRLGAGTVQVLPHKVKRDVPKLAVIRENDFRRAGDTEFGKPKGKKKGGKGKGKPVITRRGRKLEYGDDDVHVL